MANFKNIILNGTVTGVEVSEKTGKNFIKVSFFKKFIKDPTTGKLISVGSKQNVNIYEGARGYSDSLSAIENRELFTCHGCIMTFPLRKGDEIIKYNRLVLQEDEENLQEIYEEECEYWREEGSLIEDKKHSESKGEDMTISQAKEKAEALEAEAKLLAEAEAAAKLLAEAAGQE